MRKTRGTCFRVLDADWLPLYDGWIQRSVRGGRLGGGGIRATVTDSMMAWPEEGKWAHHRVASANQRPMRADTKQGMYACMGVCVCGGDGHARRTHPKARAAAY